MTAAEEVWKEWNESVGGYQRSGCGCTTRADREEEEEGKLGSKTGKDSYICSNADIRGLVGAVYKLRMIGQIRGYATKSAWRCQLDAASVIDMVHHLHNLSSYQQDAT